ncbi:uncharacterized protein LOC132872390 isoform X2 [Neoarius graeffei]|uniref:uncharacterized protein LOC132872390 isoform X2 n=1 Tax=Neoarius graeffei TaxID=443677 RepID=UPI00298CD690|nr:uncharacterized protein LOC132872390 isoform X2 [Neoarius graeffei]
MMGNRPKLQLIYFTFVGTGDTQLKLETVPVTLDIQTFTLHTVLLWLMFADGTASVPGFTSTVGKLGQPATLSCMWRCSGSVKWTMIQRLSPDVVVAWCDQSSCSSVEGFIMSHPQYMEGNLSLAVTAAAYSRRGWYMCRCDGEDVCQVSLRIEPVEVVKPLRPGDSLAVDVVIPERVEVAVQRSADGGDGAQSSVSVRLCTVDGRTFHCDPEYERRVSFTCSLTLTAVNETDGGVYTVRDTDNDEIISKTTLTLTGKQSSWNLKRIFKEEWRGVAVGVSLGLGVFGVPWLVQCCCFIRRKVEKCRRCSDDHSRQNEACTPGENVKLNVFDDDLRL